MGAGADKPDHTRNKSEASSTTVPSHHDTNVSSPHLKSFIELTEKCLAEIFCNPQSKTWHAICLTASLHPIHPEWQNAAKAMAVVSKMEGVAFYVESLIEWKLQFQFLIDQQYGPDANHHSNNGSSVMPQGQTMKRNAKGRVESNTVSNASPALPPLHRESRQRQNVALEIAFFRIIYICLLEWTRHEESATMPTDVFEKLYHLAMDCLMKSEWIYSLSAAKSPVHLTTLSALLYSPIYYLTSRVVSLLGLLDFRAMTEGVLASIAELLQQPQPNLIELPRLLGLIECLRFLELKMYPLDRLEQVSYLLYTCGKLGETSASIMASSTTKNSAVLVRLAWSRLFHFWLLPMVSSLTAELNVPSLVRSVSTLYDTHSSLVRKSSKQYSSLTPLVSLLLCTSRRDTFVSKWTGLTDFISTRLLKDKAYARMGFTCLSRLVWIYLYRVSESYAEIATHLSPILRALYNASMGPGSSATTGTWASLSSSVANSDTSRYSKPYTPVGLPLYHHIRFLSMIGTKSLELVCHSVLLEGVGVASLLSSHSFSRQTEWTNRFYQYFLQWWSTSNSTTLLSPSPPLATIQKETICAEKAIVCLYSFLHMLVDYILQGKSPPPFPIESCYCESVGSISGSSSSSSSSSGSGGGGGGGGNGSGNEEDADPEYSYYHFDATESLITPSASHSASSSYTFQGRPWTSVTSEFSNSSLDRYCVYFEAAAYGRQEIFDKFARATLTYLEASEAVLVRLLEMMMMSSSSSETSMDSIASHHGSVCTGLPGSVYMSLRQRSTTIGGGVAVAAMGGGVGGNLEPFQFQHKSRRSIASLSTSGASPSSHEWLDDGSDTSSVSSNSEPLKLASTTSTLVEWLTVLVRYIPWICVHYASALPGAPQYRPMMIGPKSSMIPVSQSSPLLRLSVSSRRICLWSLIMAACYPYSCPIRLAGQQGLHALLTCSSPSLGTDHWLTLVLRVLEDSLEVSCYYHPSKSIALLHVYLYILEVAIRGPISAMLAEMILVRALLCLCSPTLEIRKAGVALLEKAKECQIADDSMLRLLYLVEESVPHSHPTVSLRLCLLQPEYVSIWKTIGYEYFVHRVSRSFSASSIERKMMEKMMYRLGMVPLLLGGVSLVAMGSMGVRDGDTGLETESSMSSFWHTEFKLKPYEVLNIAEHDILWLTENRAPSSAARFQGDLVKLLLSLLQFQYSAHGTTVWMNSMQSHVPASAHPVLHHWSEWSVPLATGAVPILPEPARSRLVHRVAKWATASNDLAQAILKGYIGMHHDLEVFLAPPSPETSTSANSPMGLDSLFINGGRSGPYWTTMLVDWLKLLSCLSFQSRSGSFHHGNDNDAFSYELWTIHRTSRGLEYHEACYASMYRTGIDILEWEWVLIIGSLSRLLCHLVFPVEKSQARCAIGLPPRLWRTLLRQLLSYSYFGSFETNSRARESKAMTAALKESSYKSKLHVDILQSARDATERHVMKALLPMIHLDAYGVSVRELEPLPNLSIFFKRDSTTRKSLVLSPLRKSTHSSTVHSYSYSHIASTIKSSSSSSSPSPSSPLYVPESSASLSLTAALSTSVAYFGWMKEEWRALIPALLLEAEEKGDIIQIYAFLLESDKVASLDADSSGGGSCSSSTSTSFFRQTMETLWRLGFDLRMEAQSSSTRMGLGRCIERLLKAIRLFLSSSTDLDPFSIKARLYTSAEGPMPPPPPPPLSLTLLESTGVFRECLTRLASLVYYLDWIYGVEPSFEKISMSILRLLHSSSDMEQHGWIYDWTLALDASLAKGAGSRVFVASLLHEEAYRYTTWPFNLPFESMLSHRRSNRSQSGNGFLTHASWDTWILEWDQPGRILDHIIKVYPKSTHTEPIEEKILAFWLKRNTRACLEWICSHLTDSSDAELLLKRKWKMIRLFASALRGLVHSQLIDMCLFLYYLETKEGEDFTFVLFILGFLAAESDLPLESASNVGSDSESEMKHDSIFLLVHVTFTCLKIVMMEHPCHNISLAALFLTRKSEPLSLSSKLTALLEHENKSFEVLSPSLDSCNLSFFVSLIAQHDPCLLYPLLSLALESRAWQLLRLFLHYLDYKIWIALQSVVLSFLLAKHQKFERKEKRDREDFILAYLQLLCSIIEDHELVDDWRPIVLTQLKQQRDASFAFKMASKLVSVTALSVDLDALMHGLWSADDARLCESVFEFLMTSLSLSKATRDASILPIAYLYYYFGPGVIASTKLDSLRAQLLTVIQTESIAAPSSFSDVLSFLRRGGKEPKIIALFYTRFQLEAFKHDTLLCNLYQCAAMVTMGHICEFIRHVLLTGKMKSSFPRLTAELSHQMSMRTESQLDLLRVCSRHHSTTRHADDEPGSATEAEPPLVVTQKSRDSFQPTETMLMTADFEELQATLSQWKQYYQHLSSS